MSEPVSVTPTVQPVANQKVVQPIIFDPEQIITKNNWFLPTDLMKEYQRLLSEVSGGLLTYEVREPIIANCIPPRDAAGWAEYPFMVNLAPNPAELTEIWLFGAPGMGFFESRIVGPQPAYCNSPGLLMNLPHNLTVMGFSYERGVDMMLEDLGHRAECTLANQVGWQAWLNTYGTVHRLPQDTADYIWQGQTALEHHLRWFKSMKPEWYVLI